jgi:hypothetical protein
MVGLLQAPHGTRLFDRMLRENRLVKDFSGDNADGSTNIIPKMGMEKLHAGYKLLIDALYAPKEYTDRVITFLREYNPPRVSYHLEWQHFLAFFRSIYLLGIRSVERLQYWKLLAWTLLRRPKLFPMAVTLAIYGFHFRKVASQHIN